ncbi:MAG: lamin tail domain-containing protein [Anaerolineaceae bacterium]
MKIPKNWLPFLLVNIIVSAATVLIVLTIWTLVRQNSTSPSSYVATQGSQPQTKPTLPSMDKQVINIENVFGAGDLESEVVRIRMVGDTPLLMQDWTLQDSDGNIFTFPDLTLYSGVVEVYTRSGNNTVISLYWGLSQPIWQQGELVSVYDPDGNLRSSYQIP